MPPLPVHFRRTYRQSRTGRRFFANKVTTLTGRESSESLLHLITSHRSSYQLTLAEASTTIASSTLPVTPSALQSSLPLPPPPPPPPPTAIVVVVPSSTAPSRQVQLLRPTATSAAAPTRPTIVQVASISSLLPFT